MQQLKPKQKEEYKETGLGYLPENWKVVGFENAILKKRIKIGKIKQQEYKEIGKYPVIDQSQNYIAGHTDEKDKLYQAFLPVIIFGDHTRIFKFVDFPFVAGADGIKVILPDNRKFDSKFFYYGMLELKIASRGYNRHYPLLREKKIPLPPLPEQKKIAAVLSVVQETKEKTEVVIKTTKELKKSLMKHLFTYGPMPVEEAENIPLKEIEIGLVSEQWDVAGLSDVCSLRKETIEPEIAKNQMYVGLEHIVSGDLKINTWGQSSDVKSTKNVFCKGDILYGKLRPYLDKVAIAHGNGICSTDILVFSVFQNKTIDDYLGNFMHTKPFLEYAIVTMTGVNHPRTSWSKLKRFKIPLPPLPVQQKIAEILSAVDEKIEAEENKKKALEELFKTLLNNLMTARIRVNHLRIGV